MRGYDPTYSYEIAIIVIDGLRRMYQEGEDAIYYITLENENYHACRLCRQASKRASSRACTSSPRSMPARTVTRCNCSARGAILREVLRARKFWPKVQCFEQRLECDQLPRTARDAQACERWNLLHPTEKPRTSYLEDLLAGEKGPFIASSDYVRAVSEQISPWIPGGLYALGTDGLGRSDLRPRLRRHFEVDAEMVVVATLRQLAREGKFTLEQVAQAIKDLGIDTEKIDPVTA